MNDQTTEEQQRELRNSIFAAKQASEAAGGQTGPAGVQNVQPIDSREYAKQELGLDIPVRAVPLPSAGKLYPAGHALHNKDRVEFRGMTTREEDILMTKAYIKKGTVISELIKSCLMDKSIDVGKMISGDRNALMIAIRSSGYGKEYTPKFSCPSCGTQNELEIDLEALGIKTLALEPVREYENLFNFTLPISKRTVGFRFLSGDEEERILKTLEIKSKKGIQNNSIVTTKLLSSIVEIDGVSDRSQIGRFVQFMPAGDSLALRTFVDTNEPGVDMSVDFSCYECDHTAEISLPLGPEFFWPNTVK